MTQCRLRSLSTRSKRACREGQELLVGDDGAAPAPRRASARPGRAHQRLDAAAPAERRREHAAVAAEIERQREGAADIVEPVGQRSPTSRGGSRAPRAARAARSRRRRRAAGRRRQTGDRRRHTAHAGRKQRRAAVGVAALCRRSCPAHRPMMLAAGARRRGGAWLDAVLPPRCLACGAIVDEPGALCADCWRGHRFIAPPHCACCGVPFASDLGAGGAAAPASREPPRLRRARAALRYDDAEQARSCSPSSTPTAPTWRAPAAAGWRAPAASLLAEAELIAPVPLHWRRLFTPPLQPGAAAGAIGVAGESRRGWRPDLLRRAALDRLAGRPQAPGRRTQRAAAPSRCIRAGRRAVSGQARPAGRRRADHRRHGRGLRPGPAARRRARSTLMS